MAAATATEVDVLYRASARAPWIIDVPELRFLMVDGESSPTGPAFAEAVETLFAVSYALRSAVKDRIGAFYHVAPLEALWWPGDPAMLATVAAIQQGEGTWSDGDRFRWRWTAMIRQPDQVTEDLVAEVVPATTVRRRLAAGPRLRFEAFAEGFTVQILHLGPYASECPTIARLHRYIGEQGYRAVGKHHEIYLGDPRRAAPERLRTILRQPVALA